MTSIHDIFREIETKSEAGQYIYRGEPECYDNVSSRLWRRYTKDAEHCDVEIVQEALLNDAKKHTIETDPIKILTEIQHYDGDTNLIDFTPSYFVALFFACDGYYGKNGRIIITNMDDYQDMIFTPSDPQNRVVAQKSRFLRHPQGNFKPKDRDIVVIPPHLKKEIQAHLTRYQNISIETVYNDLHGYIKYQHLHGGAYTQFFSGIACENRGEDLDTIISHHTRAIESNPNFGPAYFTRGRMYIKQGNIDLAIADYNRAIELNPDNAMSYHLRGHAYFQKEEHDIAIVNYSMALILNPGEAIVYIWRGNAYKEKGDMSRAIKDFRRAVGMNPNLIASVPAEIVPQLSTNA